MKLTIYVAFLLFVLAGCKKGDQVICFTCNAPSIEYSLVRQSDTINYVYSLFSQKSYSIFKLYEQEGYNLTTDTDWSALIDYNICYSEYDYNQIIYPNAGQFFDKFCIKQ